MSQGALQASQSEESMTQGGRSTRRAVSILLSSVILLGNLVATILYLLFAFSAPDSAAVAYAGIEPALFVALFCATPLSIGSIVVHIGRWRHARLVLLLMLIASLVSGGLFITLLVRLIPL